MVYFIVDLEIMVLLSPVMVEFRSSYSTVVAWGSVSCNSSATLTSTGNHRDENGDEEEYEQGKEYVWQGSTEKAPSLACYSFLRGRREVRARLYG